MKLVCHTTESETGLDLHGLTRKEEQKQAQSRVKASNGIQIQM